MKICPICNEEFEPYPSYRKYCCIACADVATKKRNRENSRKYALRHPDKVKAKQARYYAKHCEELKDKVNEWRDKNRAHYNKYMREYRQKYLANAENRRRYNERRKEYQRRYHRRFNAEERLAFRKALREWLFYE